MIIHIKPTRAAPMRSGARAQGYGQKPTAKARNPYATKKHKRARRKGKPLSDRERRLNGLA